MIKISKSNNQPIYGRYRCNTTYNSLILSQSLKLISTEYEKSDHLRNV